MKTVYIGGKQIRLKATQSVGKGGEADVYDLGNGQVVKLFKQPSHPDFLTDDERQAAKAKLKEHQNKLPAFPGRLPDRVVVPTQLVTNKAGAITGYTMRFLKNTNLLYKYSTRKFRAGIGNRVVTDIFKDLHLTINGVHRAGVVIGDFNDLNILVDGTAAYLIDADSMQFGPYYCKMFTTRFVDPLVCLRNDLLLAKPHNPNSDWYAYAIMLMQSLLFVGPYGGVYRPKDKKKKISHDDRPLHRVTVFNPEVKYPKPALPYQILPDDLLHYFHQVFHKDIRGIFPEQLLESLCWSTCKTCGIEHARSICPDCATVVPGVVKQVVVIRGTVTATTLFQTAGHILHAVSQGGHLHWIYHADDQYKRQSTKSSSQNLLNGKLDPKTRYRISGDRTFIAKTSLVITIPNQNTTSVDNFKNLPMFDANDSSLFWLQGGQLFKEGPFDSADYIGDVLTGQTLFWVGSHFGFGYWRTGSVYNGFVFDKKKQGVDDSINLPQIKGQLIDSTCAFSKNLVWFFITAQEKGKQYNHCTVLSDQGKTMGTATATPGDGSWLGQIRGKFAVGNQLYAPTDDGLVRVELDNQAFKLKEFPDTEPFVDSGCSLFPSQDGIFVVGPRVIRKLQIK
jgi:H/ACA ribonucleoprotein complex subunit 3